MAGACGMSRYSEPSGRFTTKAVMSFAATFQSALGIKAALSRSRAGRASGVRATTVATPGLSPPATPSSSALPKALALPVRFFPITRRATRAGFPSGARLTVTLVAVAPRPYSLACLSAGTPSATNSLALAPATAVSKRSTSPASASPGGVSSIQGLPFSRLRTVFLPP